MTDKNNNKNIGMLTVRNEVDVIDEFLDDVALYFDSIVVMDDSTDGTYERIAARPFVKYLIKYGDIYDPNGRRTDGQKQHLFEHIIENYGHGVWITNLNADAFFADDPNAMIEKAERENSSVVQWDCWTFYPHETDRAEYEANKEAWCAKPIRERLTMCTDTAWPEDLQWKSEPGQRFDVNEHARVIPHGIVGVMASFSPALLHYPLRSPEQIIARRDDRAQTGFRSAAHFQNIIDSGGFANETHEHWGHFVKYDDMNVKKISLEV
jgi:hypothetical protein